MSSHYIVHLQLIQYCVPTILKLKRKKERNTSQKGAIDPSVPGQGNDGIGIVKVLGNKLIL